jgi:catechol-2,3-dioxygenase
VSTDREMTGMHVSVPVLDTGTAIEFYSAFPGVLVIERSDDLCQLYIGPNRISLKKVEPNSTSLQSDGRDRIRARHFGFAVASASEVDQIELLLRERGHDIIAGASERPDARAMFCCDPSGNQIEVYFDRLVDAR